MTSPRQSQRFPKSARVRSRLDFAKVYECGVRASDHHLSVTAILNELSMTRLGLAVSKRFGNAVQRNQFKRRLRDVFRRSRDELPQGLDLVVQPRSSGAAKVEDLRDSLISLGKRAAKKLKHQASQPNEAVSSNRSAAPGAQ